MKMGKMELLVIIILCSTLLYTRAVVSSEYGNVNLEILQEPANQEIEDIINQKIVSHTLTNSSSKTWNLYKSYTNGFTINKDNFSEIIAFFMSDENYLSAHFGAYFNLSITIEFKAQTTLYHASPLSNDTHFSLGKSANMVTNLYFVLECGYYIGGNIGDNSFYDDFHFFKDGNWSYQIPAKQWEISLLEVPVLGEYLSRFLKLDFNFIIDIGPFKTSFHGFIGLEPKIICQTSYLSETSIDGVSVSKYTLDTPEDIELRDIRFQTTKDKTNVTLEEKLDCILESQLGLDFKFGHNTLVEFDLSNPVFDLCPSKAFTNEFAYELKSNKISLKLTEITFPKYTIDIVNYDISYISKNLLEKTILETPFCFPTFNLSLSNVFNAFLPFPLDMNVSLDLSFKLTFVIEGKHRTRLIAPRYANINDTIDLLLIPLSTESQITGDLDLNLYFSIPFLLFDNITLSKHNSFVESMYVPLGIEENDIRGLISSFLPQIYDETSVAIDLGSSFEHSQLVLDLAPTLLSDQIMTYNFNSSNFNQNEEIILKSAENKITTLTIVNGTIYNQLQANVTGDGSLQTNSSLQPKLYFKADLLGKTITIPLPLNLMSEIPISSQNLTGTLITKSTSIPTYFIDKDITSPIIIDFYGYWHIDDLSIANSLELNIKETQSGLKEPTITPERAQINPNFNVSTITLILLPYGLERESDSRLSGVVHIEIEDNKGNWNSYDIYIYHDISSTNDSPSPSDISISIWGYIAFFVVIVGIGVVVNHLMKKS